MQFRFLKYTIQTIFVSYCLCSCDSSDKIIREHTYLGGEIVNPNTNYVILSDSNGNKDTIQLDENNRFIYKIENIEDGIYFFKHNPENQTVLLEKGDSIMLRLNTIEFDESLVFTGDGARKNNFLIDIYLQNEAEREKLRRSGLRLSPLYFKKDQDSLLKPKLKAYQKLTDKYELSSLAKKITQASVIFDYYTRHELYFNSRYGIAGLDVSKELPNSFFDYRNGINFNDNELKRLYAYNRFLNYYFTNASLTNDANEYIPYKNKTENTIYKLDLIDSIVQHPYIKNNLFRRVTTNFILDSKNNIEANKVLTHYLSLSSNKKSQRELRKLSKAIAKLRPNNTLPEQQLITSKGETIKLSSLYNNSITAFYFWSMDRKDHYTRAHTKASYLGARYPNIDFIAINTDDQQTKNWLKTIKRHHYNLNYEYEFKYPKCSSEELVIHNRNKVILVDKDGKIINANTDLFSSVFEKQLMKYTKAASLQD